MNKLPKTRTQNFVVQATANELLVYDLITNKAFCLNETATIVFNACDGKTTFAELNQKHNFTDEFIFLTLDSLKKENLLDENFNSPFDRLKRREIIKKIGLATMITLPLISSVVAPVAAQAASTCNAAGSPSFGTISPTTNRICTQVGYRDDRCCSAVSKGTFIAPNSCINIRCTEPDRF